MAGESARRHERTATLMPLGARTGGRLSLHANEATLIEYQPDGQLLWWDGVPIGRLVDAPDMAPELVFNAVGRLHRADVEAMAARRERMMAEALRLEQEQGNG